MGPFYKKFRCDKFFNWSISTRGLLPSKNDEFHETRGLLPSKNDEFHETRGLLPSKMMNFMKPGVFYLQKMMNFMKMRTFYKKTTSFYKKLNFAYLQKTQTSNRSFIKNSIFGINRDPCLTMKLYSQNGVNWEINANNYCGQLPHWTIDKVAKFTRFNMGCLVVKFR